MGKLDLPTFNKIMSVTSAGANMGGSNANTQ